MFTCISCKKQTSEETEVEGCNNGTPIASAKSLTSQIKDIALKVSSSLHFKPSTRSSDHTLEGVQYPHMADVSTPPTPGWDYESFNHLGGSSGTRIIEGSSGNHDPRRDEALSSIGELASSHTTRHLSSSVSEIVEEDRDGSREWMAEVEEGVHMTFLSLPDGGNELIRIQFSRDMFSRWQAQRWWVENYNKIIELYNIRRTHPQDLDITPPPTPTEHVKIEEQPREATYPSLAATPDSPMSLSIRDWAQGGFHHDA